MKKHLIAIAMFITILNPTQLFAKAIGSESGNGGNAVLIDGHVKLLDLVENNNGYINPQNEPYYIDVLEKMNLVTAKIEWQVSWPMQLTWVLTDSELERINDQGIVATTLIGSIQQIAVQKDNVVLINRPLFQKMSNRDKAALMVHELLINSALQLGFDVQSSIGTAPIRQTVGLLFSDNSNAVAKTFFQKIWDTLPVLLGSRADKKINKLKDAFLSYGNILFSGVINPQILINEKYYPIKISEQGSDDDSFWVCRALGFRDSTSWGVKGEKLQSSDFLVEFNYIENKWEVRKFPSGTEYYAEVSCNNNY